MNDDLIQSIMKITEEYIDSPSVFHEALAYHLISSTLGRFCEMPDVKVTRPNVWFVISCIPGRGRRSSLINLSSTSYLEAWKLFYEKSKNIDTKEAQENSWRSIIEAGTTQGICDSIVEGCECRINGFNFCSGEFGGILKDITSSKHYSSGVDTLLSRLYYGEYYKEDLSRRANKKSRFIPEGLYVTMFTAMQEPRHYLSHNASRQGLLRRMRIIYVKPSDFLMERWKSPFHDNYKFCKKELKMLVGNLIVPKMIEMNTKQNSELTPMTIDDGVKVKINEIAWKTDKILIEEASDFNIYQQTRWEHLTKYTVLTALSNGRTHANINDYHKALKFDALIDKHAKEMMDELETTFEVEKENKYCNRIERKIQKAGPNGISHSLLMNAFPNISLEDKKTYVSVLQEQDKIKAGYSETNARFYTHSSFIN